MATQEEQKKAIAMCKEYLQLNIQIRDLCQKAFDLSIDMISTPADCFSFYIANPDLISDIDEEVEFIHKRINEIERGDFND